MPDLEGRTLDRYKLQRLMGKGGMADVFMSYDPHFDREVAVKVFKREDENLLRRFVREAHLMASLSHPHLMPVYDAGSTVLDGTNVYYIVMPLMIGGTLRARIRNYPLSPSEACCYLRDIAGALDYIHQQGIIHRDIKSSNVLLDADDRCYLADFGIARASTDETQTTSTGNIMGTVDYIAPELVETNQRADVRSDFYSLGVLLFEMVTGMLPFRGENQIAVVAMHVGKRPPSPRSIVPTLSRASERVIYKALEKRPEQRYGSATKLAEAFCQAAAKQPLANEPLAEPVWHQATRAVAGEYIQHTQHFAQAHQAAYLPYLPPPATGSMSDVRSTDISPAGRPSYPLPIYARYSPQQNRKHRLSARTPVNVATIMKVVALLAIVLPIIYMLAIHSHSQSSDAAQMLVTAQARQKLKQAIQSAAKATQQAQSETATAQLIATGTVQANATATQQAQNTSATALAMAATGTAQVNATATAMVIETATAGQPAYSDPFNNPHDPAQIFGWDQKDNACSFQPDGYHVMATSGAMGNLQGCYQSVRPFQNFAAKVDMELTEGQSGGLFFRGNTLNTDSGYLFEVDNTGAYRLSYSANFSTGRTILQNWTASSALSQGYHVKNTLEVIAQRSNLKLYANGAFLTALQDINSTNGGYIGLLAGIDAHNANAETLYTNLSVYHLQ